MKRLFVLACLGLIFRAEAAEFDPRGSRPVQQATRSEKCAAVKEWPFCTDDDWGPKCPSGCRIQGLMDKNDHGLVKRIEKIRNILDQNKVRHRSTDQVSKQTHDYLKDKLLIDADNDNNYYGLAQNLRQRITDMKIKIDRQLRTLAAMKDRVKDQVVEMQRLEVDIDIKIRACKGSCSSSTDYEVDMDSYVTLDKQIDQLESQSSQSVESVKTLHVMTSRQLKDATSDTIYKSGPGSTAAAQQTEDLFPGVNTVQLVLEQEGSKTSPATVSKDSGTSYSSSSSSTVSSSSSGKSITDLSGSNGGSLGGGFDSLGQPSTSHVTTSTVYCTKTLRKTIVVTKDGPVEQVEEVIGGGPGCKSVTDFTKGGMSTLFPTLTHTSSSSSSVSTKSLHVGGSKGSLTTGSDSGLGDPFASVGMDLGPFLTGDADDDLPDFHARSVKSARVQRQADYVGKDCVDAQQKHLSGETNGLFKIKPGGADTTEVVEVYCQQEGLMGGWLLVQQRESGALSFNRTWAEYRSGFGSVDAQGKGELWLGNQNLHLLTNQGETMLRVELEDWEGGVATAEYTVSVGSEGEGFPLHVSAYTGDAGDALMAPQTYPSHNGMKFSTFDNDGDAAAFNCAQVYGGGWWYNNCQAANLNGFYYKGAYELKKPFEVPNGVTWATYKPDNYSLKTVRMFVRPATF